MNIENNAKRSSLGLWEQFHVFKYNRDKLAVIGAVYKSK
jgi:hypothetical protein